MSVPIATSVARLGFGAQLSLSYDSGAGNGPFGLGWSLSIPSIMRKTDKGLPKYRGSEESDVFILSGAEDLVPVLKEQGGKWVRDSFERTVDNTAYRIQRYRPRIEGLFARIERWTNNADPADTFWRSISRDNITTWYGRTADSRIADPADSTRIFTWLICRSHDDKGNALVYSYKREDSAGVNAAQAHERNRTDKSRSAQLYLKRIRYGNHAPYLPKLDPGSSWPDPPGADEADGSKNWFFEVVFDYGEHDDAAPGPRDAGVWSVRNDPFSSYRSGFEVRTYRLCQRVLMFHHFPGEPGVGADCLVQSTDFTYSYEQDPTDIENSIFSQILSITQAGYKRRTSGGYLKKSLPPVEFTYSEATVDETLREVDPVSLENLPAGLDGALYQWVDLDGEGISGVLTEQAGTWFYKRNLSPLPVRDNGSEHLKARFAPVEVVASKPALSLAGGQAQFMDLAGDGQLDLVQMEGPVRGFYERTRDADWASFRPFKSWPNIDTHDPNLRFVDLTGDGHADILIAEDDAFIRYDSLGEEGFAYAGPVPQGLDEELGPRLVFADGTQSIYLADMSGDGLTDLVRIRNGEVCYWPHLGYGRFGAKVTMDDAPWFDHPDQFDQRRIRLADIDGSGTTDIIYVARDGVHLHFNQCGNSWRKPRRLSRFPHVDSLSSVTVVDLLGNGTACLVWSSPLPADAHRPMRYIDLMGGTKPHLLTESVNNLGAETQVRYAPSTRFYLADKRDGKPWITRLPFPVHVVERVETFDHISRNRFVTRYVYHHGYFDGVEREFRGFGMVEQRDTARYAVLEADGILEDAENLDEASHVPPVVTKTWFHTGAHIENRQISKQFEEEYYHEGDPSLGETGLTQEQRQALLLDDTVLPEDNLTPDETREACRSLKGSILRQEIYAEDGTEEEDRPYHASERNYTVELLQPRGKNKHAVFFTHPRETIDFHHERTLHDVAVAGQKLKLGDPRVSHNMTLAVDDYGNVLRSVTIGYRRRDFPEVQEPEQKETHITLTANRAANRTEEEDCYHVGLPVETQTYEVVEPPEPDLIGPVVKPFRFKAIQELFEGRKEAVPPEEGLFPSDKTEPEDTKLWPYEKWDWRRNPANTPAGTRLRLIEHLRTLYRPDDLGSAQNNPLALLPLGETGSLALPGETCQLAFTAGLLAQTFQRPLDVVPPPGAPPPESLLPDPAQVLPINASTGKVADRGGYVDPDGDGCWWIPSGRIFYSDSVNHSPAKELAEARSHFFLPRRYRDPFGHETTVSYDGPGNPLAPRYDLLVARTTDALGNTVQARNDYRVLQPDLAIDPNRNRTQVAFDALGMVTGTAVMGKEDEPDGKPKGDSLDDFEADLTQAQIDGFCDAEDPHAPAPILLKDATTRIIYDLDRFHRTQQAHPKDPTKWLPAYASTLARETHVSDPLPPQGLKIQISFSYSDGFGREIQKKIQAEPGPLVEGGPVVSPRWVGSGWTIFNNKGKPVRKYEPFFSQLPAKRHRFEFGVQVGVSPVLFYDPVERVIATLNPNHTYEKVVFDPWQQVTFDVNDTITLGPSTDDDVKGFFLKPDGTSRIPASEYLPTWHELRTDPSHAVEFAARYPSATDRSSETSAAVKAAAHANTPTTAYFDTLGRTFLTVAHNKVSCPNHNLDGTEDKLHTRVEFDIEGNQRAVIDAKGRVVVRYSYHMAGPDVDEEDAATNRIHQAGMEAGERWLLNDVAGNPFRAWDSRGFTRRMTYDELRRPTGLYVTENGAERLAEQTIYGESRGDGTNHRTRVYQVRDGAGLMTSVAYDFKGNLLESERELLPITVSKQGVNWLQNPAANDGSFTSRTTYDALDRARTVTSPDGSIYRPTFNEANLLDKVAVNLRGAAVATPFVTDIDYNAKGQRVCIAYGNNATTSYNYDPLTFRLTHMKTTRPAGLNGVASQIFKDPSIVQDLHYTYDPAGNISRIADAALKTVFNGQQIDPVCRYTYDALYRLIEAKGREHIGQTAFDFNPPNGNYRDYPFVGHRAHPNDLQALRNYVEQYEYDAVGNFETLHHTAQGGNWTRTYFYEEDSLIESGVKNNRLTRTRLGNGFNHIELYTHDAHGNMTSMPHLAQMVWDFKDQLQEVDLGGGGTACYVYDAGGQRVRKVIESQNGTRRKERIYLGGFEIYHEYDGNGTTVKLERESLHITDEQQRIALVETKTQDTSQPPAPYPQPLIRYQFGNHLGSASVELDADGALISYEEYHPYGTTAFQAGRSAAELNLKRYRYTSKERDEESSLHYCGARYYAPWLGRWMSPDPAGLRDSLSLYAYTQSSPMNFTDPTGTQEIPFDYSYAIHHQPSLEERASQAVSELRQWLAKCKGKVCAPPEGWHFTRMGERAIALYDLASQPAQAGTLPELRLVHEGDPGNPIAGVEKIVGPYAGPLDVTSSGSYSTPTYRWKPVGNLFGGTIKAAEPGLVSEDPIFYLSVAGNAVKLGFASLRMGVRAAVRGVGRALGARFGSAARMPPGTLQKAGRLVVGGSRKSGVGRLRVQGDELLNKARGEFPDIIGDIEKGIPRPSMSYREVFFENVPIGANIANPQKGITQMRSAFSESYRLLQSGGRLRILTGGRDAPVAEVVRSLEEAGFRDVGVIIRNFTPRVKERTRVFIEAFRP